MNQEEKRAIYEEYKANLDEVDAKKDELTDDAKEKYEELKARFAKQLESIQEAGEESVEETKTRIEMAWKALKDTISG